MKRKYYFLYLLIIISFLLTYSCSSVQPDEPDKKFTKMEEYLLSDDWYHVIAGGDYCLTFNKDYTWTLYDSIDAPPIVFHGTWTVNEDKVILEGEDTSKPGEYYFEDSDGYILLIQNTEGATPEVIESGQLSFIQSADWDSYTKKMN